jgi:predicted dehydrogenase
VSVRVFVVALGSIGRRHLENLQALGCRAGGGRLDAAARERPDAIVIATPTSEHVAGLQWAVRNGVHAYVEKPLGATSEGVAELLDEAEAAGLVVATGYNLRFHPALEAVERTIRSGRVGRLLAVDAQVGHHLPAWHPAEDYRRSYAARRELGGGALLTLSHELDYVRWIAGEVTDCRGLKARASELELDVDDVAAVVMRHGGGALSSIRVDFVDRSYNRRSRWVGESGTITWEWGGPVRLEPGGEQLWADPEFDLGETYRSAMSDFLGAIRDGGRPRCDGRAGLRVLELCEAVPDAV